jgi:hypothetical protein
MNQMHYCSTCDVEYVIKADSDAVAAVGITTVAPFCPFCGQEVDEDEQYDCMEDSDE